MPACCSTAAAIIVTRVSDDGDIAHDVRHQLLASPSVLYTATGIMFVLAMVPGMPHLPFLLFSALLGFTGWRMSGTYRRRRKRKRKVFKR
ncbi:FHIPEP family type III secretion protein [Escherichia coli]